MDHLSKEEYEALRREIDAQVQTTRQLERTPSALPRRCTRG